MSCVLLPSGMIVVSFDIVLIGMVKLFSEKVSKRRCDY